MDVNAKFRNRIGILAGCILTGVVGAVVLYYGIFFVLALVNYFDNFYKHDTFYALYPTAISYLITYFSCGTLKHLPGYEIEINLGLPLMFGCGMVFLGFLLVFLLRKNALTVSGQGIRGKGILRKGFDLPRSQLRSVRTCPFGGVILTVEGKSYLFLCMKNRKKILDALAGEETTI